MLIIGDKEAESGLVSVRTRSGGDMGTMPVDDFISMLTEKVESKAIEL